MRRGILKDNGDIKHTFSSVFLLPTIGYTTKDFGEFFINVHIEHDNDEPKICVILDNNTHEPLFNFIITKMRENNDFLGIDQCEDEVVLRFKIPKKYNEVYHLFLEGKYSKFPDRYKDRLVVLYGRKVCKESRHVTEYNVLYPQDYKRKQIAEWTGENIKYIEEVLDAPDLSYELYKPLYTLDVEVMAERSEK